MPTLHIALQDGFSGQAVAIRVGGREVYRRDGVKTDLRISRADEAEAEAPTGPVAVEVEAGGAHAEVRLDAAATPHLRIDRTEDGALNLRPSTEPAAFL
ncbi:MAG TPA: hypothetical protein VG939_05495 [Caulobacteraceae bacterium]|nr:hypothetical protein [Caulobacteraceae bacterium]